MQKGITMNYLSVCSGIEAASVAWNEVDWEKNTNGRRWTYLTMKPTDINAKLGSTYAGEQKKALTGTETTSHSTALVGAKRCYLTMLPINGKKETEENHGNRPK